MSAVVHWLKSFRKLNFILLFLFIRSIWRFTYSNFLMVRFLHFPDLFRRIMLLYTQTVASFGERLRQWLLALERAERPTKQLSADQVAFACSSANNRCLRIVTFEMTRQRSKCRFKCRGCATHFHAKFHTGVRFWTGNVSLGWLHSISFVSEPYSFFSFHFPDSDHSIILYQALVRFTRSTKSSFPAYLCGTDDVLLVPGLGLYPSRRRFTHSL